MSNKSKKYHGPFDLIRLWKHIRDAVYYEDSALVEITVDGLVLVTPEILDGMKKSKFILQSVSNSIGTEYVHAHELLKEAVDVQCECDVPMFIHTTFTFKYYHALALEDDYKNDEEILKEIKPEQTEIRVGARDSVCGGCSPNHPQGDDLNR